MGEVWRRHGSLIYGAKTSFHELSTFSHVGVSGVLGLVTMDSAIWNSQGCTRLSSDSFLCALFISGLGSENKLLFLKIQYFWYGRDRLDVLTTPWGSPKTYSTVIYTLDNGGGVKEAWELHLWCQNIISWIFNFFTCWGVGRVKAGISEIRT